MAEDLDHVVAAARSDLRVRLTATPPDMRDLTQRARRRHAMSGVVAAILVVAVAVPLVLRDPDNRDRLAAGPSPTESNADLLGPGESRKLPRSPLAGRSTMAAVWTGRKMVIWGGEGRDGQLADGAAYDPRAEVWTLLPDAPLGARNAPAVVWTGEEVVLWGGSSGSGGSRDGAAYNPETRSWRSIAEAPFASAGLPVGIWTGSEMIVLAGLNSRAVAVYDPIQDRWRTLPDLPGQLQAPNTVGVWADGEIVTVVDADPSGGVPGARQRLVSLRLGGSAWSNVRDLPSGQAVLAWTGDAVLVATGSEAFEVRSGNSTSIATAPTGIKVRDTPTVWTGAELLLWEGDTASAIAPGAKTWRVIPSGESSQRTQPALVWADGVMLTWGGFEGNHGGGVMLRPPRPHSPGG